MIGLGCGHSAVAQESAPKPTRTLPALWPLSDPLRVNSLPAPPPPATPGPVAVQHPAPAPPPAQLPAGVIAWDSETQEYTTKPGDAVAPFTFHFTNISSGEVTINSVGTSCGCTVAKMPPLPWKLEPGTNGAIPVTMNLAGKGGTVFKTVTVNTDKGFKALIVKAVISPSPGPSLAGTMDRAANLAKAKADRQAVFKGDCARCHVEPAKGKLGKELYAAACGICHEAEHRATMVADLHAIKEPTNAEFWNTWIAHSKAGSLMPAFSQADGGPLNEAQINSLVQYLVATIPSHAAAQTAHLQTATN